MGKQGCKYRIHGKCVSKRTWNTYWGSQYTAFTVITAIGTALLFAGVAALLIEFGLGVLGTVGLIITGGVVVAAFSIFQVRARDRIDLPKEIKFKGKLSNKNK